MSRISRLDKPIAAMILLASVAYAASTKIRLTTQVIDQPTAGQVLAGPISGAAAVPTFRAYDFTGSSSVGGVGSQSWGQCTPTASSLTCIGLDPDSSWTEAAATSTLPAHTVPTSDTTGASCTGRYPNVTGAATWYTGRNLVWEGHAALGSLAGILALGGVTDTGGLGSCVNTQPAANTALFRYSTSVPDTNFMCVTTDGDGANSEVSDSGIAADTNFHQFKIWFDNSAGNVKFYIDGALVCTNSTQIPVNVLMRNDDSFIVYCATCGGVAKTWLVAQHELYTTPF